ncbi:MAG TPA: poly(R)-hydroxyalkanoic acid synthase subunit PhaE [Nitrososphaerales archaeon]|nr:poly(R)-hydroxyalkanoic acid synthase subunit PhaE [Nitrososphaerales archaeon]
MEPAAYEKFYKAWLENTKKFLSPWSLIKGETSPPFSTPSSSATDAPDWTKDWSKLMEGMLSFPYTMMIQGIGGTPMSSQKDYGDLLNGSLDLYKEWVDVSLDFSKTWLEASSSVFAKLNAMTAKAQATSPDDYMKQIYNVWVEELEGKMDHLLHDPGFSSKLASLLSKYLDVKEKSDSMAEKYYRSMNIPTRSEIDSIYKEIHELKKKLSKFASSDSSPTSSRKKKN